MIGGEACIGLQQTHDVGHRKDHLNVGVLFGRESAELLNGSLLFDLIAFLPSDSRKFNQLLQAWSSGASGWVAC